MKEIICPNCSKAFKIDEAGYADIVRQIRDKEFAKDLKEKIESVNALHEVNLQERDSKAKELLMETIRAKDVEIERLGGIAKNVELNTELAINKATGDLESKLAKMESDIQLERSRQEISKAQVEAAHSKSIQDLQHKLELKIKEAETSEANLRESHRQQIEDREQQIERLKELKAKLSTKMLGETLEQHCEIEFNRIRHTAFPNAFFEKDNDASSGTKGDYIFREQTSEGAEIISIMFEMKNEGDSGPSAKKKNEDYLKKLDKDRTEKGCEYAVLVSLLERDSDYYNGGIVDMSHRFPKMYVIRPQFFIPIITLLYNASMKSVEYKNELEIVKSQQEDVTNFENELEAFKNGFQRNVDLFAKQYQASIDAIDKSMDYLQKTKDSLTKAANNLRLANNKAQDVTIKRLTRNNPTMQARFRDSRLISGGE